MAPRSHSNRQSGWSDCTDDSGFEVKNLEEFCKKLEAAGQKFDRPYGRIPNSTIAIAFLTDLWGHLYRADGKPGAIEVKTAKGTSRHAG
ncbi:MAG TPA: hypothetical protein VFT39_02730 [Vicinamibacterales bacterium]|nr:hypothetical protein [Vicinamibacterales bacterium]